jgi:hypothetical protein
MILPEKTNQQIINSGDIDTDIIYIYIFPICCLEDLLNTLIYLGHFDDKCW